MTTTTDQPEPEQAPPVVEGTGRELEQPAAGSHSVTTVSAPAALTARPTREALVPLDAEAVIAGMDAYQQLLPRLLDESDYQGTGSDRFVKKSGWRKIARAFNLSVTIVAVSVERDGLGKPTRAECVARAAAPNGQVQDADGYCTISEFTGRRADDVKLENTLRATATTRAKNRAIADLVGMGEVSAEETEQAGTPPPPYGPPVAEGDRQIASRALTYLIGDDAATVWGTVVDELAGGYMPAVVAGTIRSIARASMAAATDTTEPEPDAEQTPEGRAADAMAESFAEPNPTEQAGAAEVVPDPDAFKVNPDED